MTSWCGVNSTKGILPRDTTTSSKLKFSISHYLIRVDHRSALLSSMSDTVVENLKARLKSLNDVHAKVQSLRQIPFNVLQAPALPTAVGDLPPPPLSVRAEFLRIKEVADEIRSDSVQEALRAAKESEARDKTGIRPMSRRENMKRKCVFHFFTPGTCIHS
jgi:hypothetical protein